MSEITVEQQIAEVQSWLTHVERTQAKFGMPADSGNAMYAAILSTLRSHAELVRDAWVPVSERLPEERANVIVYDGYLAYQAYRSGSFWYADDDGAYGVTHWRPLPAPPALPKDSP